MAGRLGDILVARGAITEEQLQAALTAKKRLRMLGETLVARSLITNDQLGVALAQSGNMERASEVFAEATARWKVHGIERYLPSYAVDFPFRGDEHRELFMAGLRKLGVPDVPE